LISRSEGVPGSAAPTAAQSDARAEERFHRTETAGSLMLSRLACAAPEDKVADVLASLSHSDIDFADSIFVVAEDGRLLGVVTPETLIEVLRHEHVEDLHRLAGIRKENVRARHAIEAPPLRRARDRLPWLLLGLLGSMLATFVMSGFEHTLGEKISIAFFVPGIVYLADAIGTQTEAIAVRGLSLSHAPIRSLLGGELRTGILLGSVLALLTFPLVWLSFRDPRLAAAVSLSLMAAGAVATTMGLLLPWLLHRLGLDPAFGSGPIATIVQDVLSLAIYFLFVVVIFA